MDDCVFCKIVKGEIPCAKVWENDQYLAFLDIRPMTKGMTLIIPKTHMDSYIYNASKDEVSNIFEASRKVVKMLENTFNINRVVVVAEGMGVNHLHLKLYPLHGESAEFVPMQAGPSSNFTELSELAEKIKSNS